jgi:hypothetical protein
MSNTDPGRWVAVFCAGVSLGCAVDSRDVGFVGTANTGGTVTGESNNGGTAGGVPESGGAGGNAPDGTGAGAGNAGELTGGGSGGSASAAAGNGGAAGSATALGGSGGTAPIVLENPLLVAPRDGFVQAITNGLGIEGAFYTTSDAPPGSSTIQPQSFAQSGPDICVSGTASQVGSDGSGSFEFARDWGAIVAVTLSQVMGSNTPGPWSRDTESGVVSGFRFTLTGPIIPSSLAFSAWPFGVVLGNHCVQLGPQTAGQPVIVSFANLALDCFAPGGTALPADAALERLQWTIQTNTNAPTPFDFCIEDLTAIVVQ